MLEKIEELCDLPHDILSNAPILKMYGTCQLSISNYKGLLEYCNNCMILQCYHCRIKITGENLWIRSYDYNEIDIRGCITNITYLNISP